MLRTMRANAKWVFYILAIAFIAWLGLSQVLGVLGTSPTVVLKVNGQELPVSEFQQREQIASEQYRQQNGGAPVSREEEKQIQDRVIDQMTEDALLQQEYKRLGIRVSDQEVIETARTSPPPEIMRDPQFQTDSQFDIRKWQQFLASTSDRNILIQLEGMYRQQIPLIKLQQYLTSDIYVSDAKLWRIYRDQHDSVKIASLAVWPSTVTDTSAISDAELSAYVAKHPDDFKRPAIAFVRFISESRLPNAADTAVARAHVDRVRAELVRGAKFEDVAKRESSDSNSGRQGGDLGWIKKNEAGFDADFMRAVRALKPGQLSAPVQTQFGYHLIRVDQAKGDSLKVRHILIPIALQGTHLDQVEARADTLERQTAEQTDPTMFENAARRLGLQVSPQYQVVENEPFTVGSSRVPDVSVWAFEAKPGETSPIVEAPTGYYVFRLDSISPAGVPTLSQVRGRASALVRLERQKTLAHHRADSLATLLRGIPDLAAAASAHGLQADRLGPFVRIRPPSYLGSEPTLVGAAFGLKTGERSGVIAGERGDFIIQSLERKPADSTAWLKQRDVQRTQFRQAAMQARLQQYMADVRARAKVVDRRKDIFKSQPATDNTGL